MYLIIWIITWIFIVNNKITKYTIKSLRKINDNCHITQIFFLENLKDATENV